MLKVIIRVPKRTSKYPQNTEKNPPTRTSAQHVVLVCKPHSQKSQKALNLLITQDRYCARFYMPLYTFLHNLLNVLVQIANKMGLRRKIQAFWARISRMMY
jgi:hypothetical protein